MANWKEIYNSVNSSVKKKKKEEEGTVELKASDLSSNMRNFLDKVSSNNALQEEIAFNRRLNEIEKGLLDTPEFATTKKAKEDLAKTAARKQLNNSIGNAVNTVGKPVANFAQTAGNTLLYAGMNNPLVAATPSMVVHNLKNKKDDSEDVRTWFKNADLFDDGWQLGDLWLTAQSSFQDVLEEINEGVVESAENVIDTGAYLYGGAAGLLGFDDTQEEVADFIARDIIDSEYLVQTYNPFFRYSVANLLGHDVEDASIFGEKSDSLANSGGQLLTQVGLQAAGVPWWVTSGVTSFGSGTEQQLAEGASYGQAGGIGLVNAGAEILTEKLFGDSILGEKGLIDMGGLTKGISNKTMKLAADYGLTWLTNGTEEVGSEVFSRLGEAIIKEENAIELLTNEEALDAYLESFIGGMVMSGVTNAPKAVRSHQTGADYNTGLTADEEAVVNKEVEKRIAEQEKDGKKLSKNEKGKIFQSVIEAMDEGSLSTDLIEEVLGGDTYKTYKDTVASEESTLKEFQELYQGEELEQQIKDLKANSKLGDIKKQLGSEVFDKVKGSRLSETYIERGRRGQKFTADLSKYDEKQGTIIQKAIDSGILNNTRRTHKFVDWIAKVSADKGVLFDFVNNEKLKNSGFAVDGKVVNGFKTKDGITLNVQSSKMLESTVGHEITHVLEGTELYNALASEIKSYAESKKASDSKFANEYIERLYNTRELYKTVKGYEGVEGHEAIKQEVIADLVGDYLFTDNDFIMNLSTKHRNVFQKMYDEIKYLYKTITAGSAEAERLLAVKKAFEDAYRATTTKQTAENSSSDGDVQYSLVDDKETIDFLENQEHLTVYKAMVLIDGKLYPPMASQNYIEEEYTTKKGEKKTRRVRKLKNPSVLGQWQKADERPDLVKSFVEPSAKYPDGYGQFDLLKSNGKTTGGVAYNPYEHTSNIVLNDQFAEAYQRPELVTVEYEIPVSELTSGYKAQYAKDPVGLTDWKAGGVAQKLQNSHRDVYLTRWSKPVRILDDAEVAQKYKEILDKEEGISVPWNVVTPSLREELEKIGVPIDYSDIKAGSTIRNFEAAMRGDYEKKSKNAKYSISTDNTGKELSAGQQEYFKDSKVRDSNGNLLTVYHTTDSDFTVFDNAKKGENTETYNTYMGFFFSGSEDYMKNFPEFENGKTTAYYLDMKNPIDMTNISKQAFLDIVEVTGGDVQEAAEIYDAELKAEQQRAKMRGDNDTSLYLSGLLREMTGDYYDPEFHEALKPNFEKLKAKGYDGVINFMDEMAGEKEYIVFDSNQAKLTTNTKPTSHQDTRYSLSSIANSFFDNESMTLDEFTAQDYHETQGYKDYVNECLNNMKQSMGDAYDEDRARESIEKQVDGIVGVAVAAKRAGYDILDSADRRSTRDSKKRLLFSSLEPNSDYFTSHDISTICDKRKNFAEIYDEIVRQEEANGVPKGKRFFDNVNNYFAIHKIMADKGLTTPCRQCYVESMRKNLAPMATAFLELVQETNEGNTANKQLYHQSGKDKGKQKESNKSTRDFVLRTLDEHPEYNLTVDDLSVEMLTTEDGLAQLRIQAPLVYEAFNSFYGQAKPKMPKSATPFRFGELTAMLTDSNGNIKKSLVDKINSTGGFRLQSYSDFQIQNYTDVLQALFEAGTLGLNGHAYTKVPAFLDATEGTNLKRNISIFMYKDGDQWKLDRNDSFPDTLEQIYDRVKADKSGNTSIIAVSQNADMSAWIMANDYVGYGIPFHKSGLKMGTVRDTVVRTDDGREIKGYSGIKDHTKQQTEVWATTTADHKANTKVKKGINVYSFWDFDNKANLSKNKLIEKNVKAYINACEKAGYLPKFREYVMNNDKVLRDVLKYSKELGFVSESATIEDISFKYKGYVIPYGYYKFLGDFGMFTPDGKAAPQKTLSLEDYDFGEAERFFKDAESVRRNEILQQFTNGKERDIYRDSNLTTAQLEELARQKRIEVAREALKGRFSLSAEGETPKTYGNFGTYGSDIALEEDLPIRQDIAAPIAEESSVTQPTISKTETVEDPFPDDLPMADDELDSLVQEKEALEAKMLAMSEKGDFGDEFYQLNEQWVAVTERVKALESEIAERDADYMDSFDDADAPPIADRYNDSTADIIPITKKLESDIARDVRGRLGITDPRKFNAVRDIIREYSQNEMPSRDDLADKLRGKFGSYTESTHSEEMIREAKKFLRSVRIKVDDTIKGDIADFDSWRKGNRNRLRFSDEGTAVDQLYHDELSPRFPGLFPEYIGNPTDELLQIEKVANMDDSITETINHTEEEIYATADAIIQAISEYRGVQKEKAANKSGRESFNSLMQDADQYVPPIDYEQVLNNRWKPFWNTEGYTAEAEIYDTQHKKGVAEGQQAMWDDPVPKVITRQTLHQDIVDGARTKFAENGLDMDEVLKNAKDLSTFATVDNTPQRVMEKALGYKAGQVLSDITVNKVAQNETEGIKWLSRITNRKNGFLAQLSKQYNIKPGSKESAAAQMYAEGFYVNGKNEIVQYGDAELAQDFRDSKKRANIKALARDPRIRQFYDATLAMINESRKRNAYPEIPRLDNYFLHFRAMDDTFSRLGLPFNPNDIRAKDLPTDLNGVTADLKPGQPYFASAMHRMGKRTSFDLLGGLERYATSAKNQIYHIDDIQTLRALRNYIADTYGQANGLEGLDALTEEEAQDKIEQVYNSHLSTFAKFLNEEANVLAGKTSLIDRGLEGIIGRRGITFLNTINQQVGKNMVGFNVSSSLTNFLPVAQTFAKTNKFDFLKAFAQTASSKVGSIFGKTNTFAESSPVMIRRNGADSFYRTPWQKVSDAGYVFMSAVDSISTELIARTKYNELTRKGMDSQQAHIETDKWVSRLMGDRSLGQQPQLYNSKMLGLVTKFQLEVRNQLDSQFYDTIQETKASTEDIQNGLARNAKRAAKITSTFVQLAVAQHLFGKAFESVAGYNPAFDIIDVLIKTFGWDDDEEDEDTVLDNIEEGFLALLGDMPYTSTLTGGRIPISSALPIKQLVTGEDDYGNEVSRWDTIKETVPYYLLPGGYGQAKKTVQGLKMFDDDLPIAGSYTDSGNLRFPVEDTFGNRLQAGIFGQYASENARDYFDNERKPLKENQIEEFIDVDIPIRDYWEYREGLSDHDTLSEKADYIDGLDLPISKKNILINNIADRKESIDMKGYGNYSSFEEFDFAEKNPEKYKFLEDRNISWSKYVWNKEEYNYAYEHTEMYDFLQENGVSYKQYKSFDEDTKDAFSWAKENPGKYAVSKAISSDFLTYYGYKKDLGELNAKDANGNTVSGLKKQRVFDYIENLDLDYGEKIILYRSMYDSKSDKAQYNADILEYLNSRNDLSYAEKKTILEELDFKVSADGTVTW